MGDYIDPRLGKIEFAEWLPKAEAARINRRLSTRARDDSYYRSGELAGLEVDRFEPNRRTIRIERTLSEVSGHIHIGEPKTRAARRKLILPSWLADVLVAHLDNWPPNESGLVFSAPGGGPLRRSFRTRYWKPAVRSSVGEPMRFHDLRHSHVALLIEQGTHPAVIASRLGHSSVRTVLDVYGHLYEGLDRGAADALKPPWDALYVDEMWSRRRSRDFGLDGP